MEQTNSYARIHISKHPISRVKLSQLRSKTSDTRATTRLIQEITSILGVEALGNSLTVEKGEQDVSALGYNYDSEILGPTRISVVPILRSGLGMVEAIQALLPDPVAVHHLGLFREPATLQPVEYYNNLPYHSAPTPTPTSEHLAIILDPIIATGGTAAAAIQTLREWGVTKIIFIGVLGSKEGVQRAVEEWDQVEVWVAGVDEKLNEKGMIVPGVGDVGDRLFGTKGK